MKPTTGHSHPGGRGRHHQQQVLRALAMFGLTDDR
jgi:hypothetical protein